MRRIGDAGRRRKLGDAGKRTGVETRWLARMPIVGSWVAQVTLFLNLVFNRGQMVRVVRLGVDW
jgi:hypothetical protein